MSQEQPDPWDPDMIRKRLTAFRVKGWLAQNRPVAHNRHKRYSSYVGNMAMDLEPILNEILLALEQFEGRLSQIEAALNKDP